MTTEPEKRGSPIVAFAVLALLALSLSLSMLLSGRDSDPSLTVGHVRAATRDSFDLTAPLTMLTAPRLVLQKGTVSLVAGQKAGSGEALYTLLSGGGADLVLDDAVFTLDAAAGADSGARGSSDDFLGPIVTALSSLSFQTLTVRGGTIIVKRTGGVEEVFTDVTAELASKRMVSLKAKGSARLRGEKLLFDAALPQLDVKPGTPLPVRFSVKGDFVTAGLDGHVLVGDRLQLTSNNAEIVLPHLRKAARWLGAIFPTGQGLGEFHVKGPLEWSKGTLSFENAVVALDGNAARGGLSATLGENNRPTLEGTLAFESLNLAPYLSASQSSSTLSLATEWLEAMRFPGTGSPSLVNEIDADIRISAASVTIGDRPLGRCAATVSVKNGVLVADLAEIELETGGTGEGQIGMDMTGPEPRYSIRGKLDGLDMGKAVGAYVGYAPIEGYGSLALDLSGTGRTGDAVLASLAGSLALDMPEGARLGVDVQTLANAAGSAPDAAAWSTLLGQSSNVDSLVARFAATGGVFTAQALSADAGDTDIIAAGAVDTSRSTLDVTVSMARAAKDAAGKESPTKSFRVHGPWSAPNLSAVPLSGKSAGPLVPPPRPWPISQPSLPDRG